MIMMRGDTINGAHARFKVSKRQNAIFLGLAIAALVAIFMYQVAYGRTDKHGSSEYILPPFKDGISHLAGYN
jgi:hypothetical protein